MTTNIKKLEQALGIGVSIITSEHFFSTFLSSPWTTEKFAETKEDKLKVRKLYFLASVSSLLLAVLIAYLTDEPAPIYGAIIVILIYIVIYERALAKQI